MEIARKGGEADGCRGGDAPGSAELGPEMGKEPADWLLKRLATTPAGHDTAEVQRRSGTYGPDDAATVKRSPLRLQLLARFDNPLIIILLIASAVSAGNVPGFIIILALCC